MRETLLHHEVVEVLLIKVFFKQGGNKTENMHRTRQGRRALASRAGGELHDEGGHDDEQASAWRAP